MAVISFASRGSINAAPHTCSISGYVVNSMGNGMPGVQVTLHLFGCNNSQMGDLPEISNVSTITAQQPYAGEYDFQNVVWTPDAKYAYVSAFVQSGNITIFGKSTNFTVNSNETSKNVSIVLHVPPNMLNTTINQT